MERVDVDEDRTRFFQCRLDDAVAQLEIGAAIQHPVDEQHGRGSHRGAENRQLTSSLSHSAGSLVRRPRTR